MAKETGNSTYSSDFLRVLLALKDNVMRDTNVAEICQVTQVNDTNDYVCVPLSDDKTKLYCCKIQNLNVQQDDVVLVIFTNTDNRLNLKRLENNLRVQNITNKTLHSSEYSCPLQPASPLLSYPNRHSSTPSNDHLY